MSMTLCEVGHDAVVYTDYDHRNMKHYCPACDALDRVAHLEEVIKELEEKLGEKG